MDVKLKEYLDSGKYLPDFMEDFHDQKTLFKRLNQFVENRNDGYTKDINWMSSQVYTVDIFLWYMASHGYTLQKSRKKISFYDVYNDLHQFEEKQREEKGNFLRSIIQEMQQKKSET